MTMYRGRWALITGASAGIGAQFVHSLARQGANIVLIARREDRLKTLAEQMRRDHGVETLIIKADLAKPQAPEEICNHLDRAGIAIDILVNNAGFGLTKLFLENPWSAHRDFIELMVTSYCALTHHLLPGMVERNYGRIIQVASLAGLVPGTQAQNLYAASKAFLVSFAQSTAAEFEHHNVYISALCPGFTITEFHDVTNTREKISTLPKAMVMDVVPVVEGAIRAVERKHVVYVPGMVNKALVWLCDALPRPWTSALMRTSSSRVRGAD